MKKLLICMILLAALLLTVVSCVDNTISITNENNEVVTPAKTTEGSRNNENPDVSGENGTTPGESTTTNSQGGGQLENAGADTAGGWGELHTVS